LHAPTFEFDLCNAYDRHLTRKETTAKYYTDYGDLSYLEITPEDKEEMFKAYVVNASESGDSLMVLGTWKPTHKF
jgi:hypothetical protein